jgi:hypothetical protein
MQFAERLVQKQEAFLPKCGKCRFPRGKFPRTEKLFSENKKRPVTKKKLASKWKKLELNSTNLKLNSKKSRSDCAKKPDPNISAGLSQK